MDRRILLEDLGRWTPRMDYAADGPAPSSVVFSKLLQAAFLANGHLSLRGTMRGQIKMAKSRAKQACSSLPSGMPPETSWNKQT